MSKIQSESNSQPRHKDSDTSYVVTAMWTIRASFPDAPRQSSSYFDFNNNGYVGQTFGCQVSDDTHFWQYDPILNQWTQLTSLPSITIGGSTAVSSHSPFSYLFGGFNIGGDFLKDIWRFNIPSDHWDSIGIMPGGLRSNTLFWVFDSLILGGYGVLQDTNNQSITGVDSLSLGTDIYTFNTRTNTWDTVICENFLDSTADDGMAGSFVFGKTAYFFGGYRTLNPNYSFTNKMWSFDASRFFPKDTTTGISAVPPDVSFTVYPNPSHSPSFSISTSESGDVIFSDALGRVIDERRLKQGVNQISLTTDDQMVFYHATLQYGATANGKVVFLR